MHYIFLSWRDLAHPLAGGSEVLVDKLASGLVEQGHRVDLLCGGPVGERPYPVTSAGGTYSQYARIPVHYLRRHRAADVVVDVANGMPYFSAVWRRGPTVCLVNHIHTEHWALWFPPPIAAAGRCLEQRVFPAVYRNRLFVAVSASTAAALVDLGIPSGQIRIVPNGVDGAAGRPVKSPEPLFLAVGRLVPHKRFDVLLRLWERVRPLTGGRLVVLGEGPERPRLTAMAGPGVSLPGWVGDEERDRLLGKAWLLLHPASVEGWGLVVMEAAARETPTLAFDVAGLRDSVVHGRTGTLVRSEDEFAAAWARLAGDGEARSALGRRALARAGEFSWARTVELFSEVGEEAVAWRRGAPSATEPIARRP
jgi:glycosyltransferase involved in cell wall biosynthesis